MRADEAVLIKCYDSAEDAPMGDIQSKLYPEVFGSA
jgi:hypothetical protein